MVAFYISICATFWLGLCGSARAQTAPSWLLANSQSIADQKASGAAARRSSSAEAAPPQIVQDLAARTRQNRARRILAAGAGLAVSAALAPAYVLPYRDRCWGSDQRKGSGPLKLAAGVGAIGVAFAIGGATWFGLESRRHGYYASRRERAIAGGIGVLTFVLGQGLLGTAFLLDQICNT